LREILPAVAGLCNKNTNIAVMLKPQFEAGEKDINKGVIKNDTLRRKILKDFEAWAKKSFKIIDKADSGVAGAKGNLERFYLLKIT
jgi:23S rRNA (cytidine1920-2'-O)/16S rRNA (cytidine1409-2'-O)-methyltransferase